jgi:beta-galactosidase
VVARHRRETTGEAVKLKAEGDLPPLTKKSPAGADYWHADGIDLQHVRISALDKKGRLVQTDNRQVNFSVDGPATIVGVINGDINSNEMTTGCSRSLYNGTCTVILRSTRQAGIVTLKATAEGLKPVELKVESLE